MTIVPIPPEDLRVTRAATLEGMCKRANAATDAATEAVLARDRQIEEWQGPRGEGKFTYDELVPITGLSRTRLGQIISGIRRKAKS